MRNTNEKMMRKEKELNTIEIAMLQYQIQRYQATGKGSMCQSLSIKIRKLMDDVNNCDARH